MSRHYCSMSNTIEQSYEAVLSKAADIDIERHNRKLRYQACRKAGSLDHRNLRIFKMAEIEHVHHSDIARQVGLKRSRVTQIVAEMKQKIAQAAPDDSEIKDHLARQRYDQALDKLRLEYALQVTGKALANPPKELTTRRFGDRDKGGKKESWEEQTSREQKLDVQAVKTYLKTAEALRKLADQATLVPGQSAKHLSNDELLNAIHEVLDEFCTRVAIEPQRPSGEFLDMIECFRAEIYGWVLEVRKGTPQHLAWNAESSRISYSLGSTTIGSPLTSLTTPPTLINLDSPSGANPVASATPAPSSTYAMPPTSSGPTNSTC